MKYNVADLEGALLDAAVAKAEGIQHDATDRAVFVHQGSDSMRYAPSTVWAQGGPIIEFDRINVGYDDQGGRERGLWGAYLHDGDGKMYFADEPLVAAMRAKVGGKFGDTVELP